MVKKWREARREMLNLLKLLPMMMLSLPLLLRRSTEIPLKKRQDLDKQQSSPASASNVVALIVVNIGLNLDRK